MERRKVLEVFGDERNVDPFRMAIIGWTAIEEMLEEALGEAFQGEFPKEVYSYKVRAALAEALGLIPPELFGPLGVVKKLRDDFAHAKRTDLDESDGRVLYKAMREIAPEVEQRVPQLKNEDPRIILTSLLTLLQEALLACFDEASARREEMEEAMRAWRKRSALSPEQIADLLRDADELE